jgi:hypothetical protein
VTTASVFIGNVDDDQQNADWLLNANKLAAAVGMITKENGSDELDASDVTA